MTVKNSNAVSLENIFSTERVLFTKKSRRVSFLVKCNIDSETGLSHKCELHEFSE